MKNLADSRKKIFKLKFEMKNGMVVSSRTIARKSKRMSFTDNPQYRLFLDSLNNKKKNIEKEISENQSSNLIAK